MHSFFKLLLDKTHHRHAREPGKTAPSLQPPAASGSADPACHGGRHTLALGESSRDPPEKEDLYCTICMEAKYSFECIAMRGCEHTYCAQCVGQYVAAKVEANEVSIGCPEPECGAGFVQPDMCRLILPAEMLERWDNRLCEEGIPGPARFYCPYKDCSAMLIHEEVVRVRVRAACPHCKRWVCARCRVPWHQHLTCEQYRKLAEQQAEELAKEQLLELARSKKWQRCPSCGFVIEKRSGCNYVVCRCKKAFCYNCAVPVDVHTRICPSCIPVQEYKY